MAIEMRQQMKMTQQLVMTPQLQQAIKLLQLSRLELQDLVRQEMEENPLLEESLEAEEVKEQDLVELSEKEDAPAPAEQDFREVTTGEETRESDWDSYLEGYNYSSGEQYYDDEDRPSYENILTRKGTLADHLMWQLNMTKLNDDEARVGAEIIGNIDEDGYLRATVEEIAQACSVSESVAESALKKSRSSTPWAWGRAT